MEIRISLKNRISGRWTNITGHWEEGRFGITGKDFILESKLPTPDEMEKPSSLKDESKLSKHCTSLDYCWFISILNYQDTNPLFS